MKGFIMEETQATIDKVEENIKKTQDFWARNNISTRTSMVVFIIGYVVALGLSLSFATPPYILDTAGWLLFSAFITVTVGINGLDKVASIIAAIKGR